MPRAGSRCCPDAVPARPHGAEERRTRAGAGQRAGGAGGEPEAVPGEPRQPAPSSAPTRTPHGAPRALSRPAERPAPPPAPRPPRLRAGPAPRPRPRPPVSAARRLVGPLGVRRGPRRGRPGRLPPAARRPPAPRGGGALRRGHSIVGSRDRETEAQRGQAARPRSPSERSWEEGCALCPRGRGRGRQGQGTGRGARTAAAGPANGSGTTVLLCKAPRTSLTYFALLSAPVGKVVARARGPSWAPPSSNPDTLGAEVDYVKVARALQSVSSPINRLCLDAGEGALRTWALMSSVPPLPSSPKSPLPRPALSFPRMWSKGSPSRQGLPSLACQTATSSPGSVPPSLDNVPRPQAKLFRAVSPSIDRPSESCNSGLIRL